MLIQNVQGSERFAIIGPAMDEVIAPDMIATLWPQPNAGSVIQPKPSLLRLFCRHFKPLPPPKPFNPLVIDLPTRIPQQSRNPAIAVAAILAGKRDHIGNKTHLVGTASWRLPLRRSMLLQNPANTTLRHRHLAAHKINTGTATGGAQKFPLTAYLRISLSSVSSETAFLSRSFSFCRRLSSFSWSVPIPPYCLRQRYYVCSVMRTSRMASTRAIP
jgi:hypothetical protein